MDTYKIAQPRTIAQAASLLADTSVRYSLMAGGTDLLDEIKGETLAPEVVIDLKTINDLSYIKREEDGVRIGALTTVAELAENAIIKNEYPGLRQAALSLATPQLRNIGTVGGNLCQRPRCWYYRDRMTVCRKRGGGRCFARNGRNRYHAIFGGGICYIVYPSDLAPALIAFGAEAIIATAKKQRTLPLEAFYVLPQVNVIRENVLATGELLQEIKLPPARKDTKSFYFKLKERSTWDFAVVSAAVVAQLDGKLCKEASIVLGGVAPVPWRMKQTEKFLANKTVSEAVLKEATVEDLRGAAPLKENTYKKELVTAVISHAMTSL